MELFDVCVIGNDIASYVAVKTLQKNGHKVAHIKPFDHPLEAQFIPSIGLADMNLTEAMIGTEGISQTILSFLQLEKTIKTTPPTVYKEILSDGRVLSRPAGKKAFQVYLIRHFPQHAEAIKRWMHDIHATYVAYQATLNPTEFQTTSRTLDVLGPLAHQFMDEWLEGYFKDPALKESVQCFTDMYPTPLTGIPVMEYLMHYFTAFEEAGETLALSFTDWVKAIKKSTDATFYTSALADVTFAANEYTVELKNKTTFKTRFLLGQNQRSDGEAVNYRWIDCELDATWVKQQMPVPVHFRKTPLFESLKVIPFHTLKPTQRTKVRLEVVSQADTPLIVTFVDRHFKGFEAAIKTHVARQPFRKNVTDLYDAYATLHQLEVREDLWDEPKWMQVPLNDALKKPVLLSFLKGVYFAFEMNQFIQEENAPKRSSLMVQAAEELMLKMEAKKHGTMVLKAGHQGVAMTVSKTGAKRIDAADNEVHVLIDALLNASETPLKEEDVKAEDALKKWFLNAINHSVNTDAKPWPLRGMLANVFVLMILWWVRDDSFAAFGFGAWLIFKETLYLMRYRRFMAFESILGIALVLLGFVQVLVPFDMGVFWIFLGALLMIVNEHRAGVLTHEFVRDPIHKHLSKLYLGVFQKRMSQIISLSFVLMGIAYMIESMWAPIALFLAAAGFMLWAYHEDKRSYIDYHGEELL